MKNLSDNEIAKLKKAGKFTVCPAKKTPKTPMARALRTPSYTTRIPAGIDEKSRIADL